MIICVLACSIEEEAIPLSEMKSIFLSLKANGFVGKLFGELMVKVSQSKGPKWVADKWDQSGLQLSNLLDLELENADNIIKDYVSVLNCLSFNKLFSIYDPI